MKLFQLVITLIIMQLLNNLSIYLIGRIVIFSIPVLLLPVLTHNISTEDYGILGLFISIYQILHIFIGLGGVGAVVRAYKDKEDGDFIFKEYLFNAMSINILLFLLALTPFYYLYISDMVKLPLIVAILLPVVVLITGLKEYKHKLWNIQSEAIKFTTFEVAFTLVSFGLSVLLVLSVLPDWRGRIYSIVFVESLFLFISLFYLFKEDGLICKFNKNYCTDVLKFGLPLLPHSIALTVIATSDKLLLGNFLGMHEVGIFTVAASVSSILLVATMALDQTLQPIIYDFFKNQTQEGKRLYVAGFYIYLLIIVLSGVILYLLTPWAIDNFIGGEFKSSVNYVGILIIAQVGYSMYRYVVMAIFFSKKTHFVSISTISSAIIGIVLQYFLISQYGIFGAAIGTAIMFLLSFAFTFYFSNKLYPMPWNKSFSIVKDIPHLMKKTLFKHKAISE